MRGRLRVLMTLDAVGGVWRYAMDLAQALRPLGADTIFLGFGPPPTVAQRAEAEALGPLDWAEAPLDWLVQDESDLAPVPGLIAEAARRHGADLLHLNAPTQAAGLEIDRPVLVASHSCVPTWFRAVRDTPLPPGWEWHATLNARGLARADLVVVPSQSHGEATRACYGPLPHLRVVLNAVTTPEPTRLPEKPVVIASGRWWDEGKGGAVLDAAAEMTNWPVLMLGPTQGPQGASFTAHDATLEGELPHAEAMALMREAAIFVSPAIYEPFGLAVAEAARMGLPLVLSDIPTFRELWDGVAVFFQPRDAERLAFTLDRLASDPHQRRRLGDVARRRSRRFTPEAQAEGMLSLYEGLVPVPAR